MSQSTNINSYLDVAAVLKTARDSGAEVAELECDTVGMAVSWRARAYAYRNLLRKQAAAAVGRLASDFTTELDDMVLTIDKRTVKIRFGRRQGTLRIGGQAVEIKPIQRDEGEAERLLAQATAEPVIELEDDDLMEAARRMVKEKGL